MNWKDIKHFIPDEFFCKKCGTCIDMDYALISALDWLRWVIGVPFIVTSGYRCVEHNKQVGGHPNSFHLFGKAADITVSRKSLLPLMYRVAIVSGKFQGIGIKENSFIHFDVGERPEPYYYIYLPDNKTKPLNPDILAKIQSETLENILAEYKV